MEGRDHWTKNRLKEKLNDRESIAYNELILLEIIQGFRKRPEREEIEDAFSSFICSQHKRSTTLLAAEIYRELQRKGKRIRSIVDCLIAATAIETGATILRKDRDFEFIAEHYPIIAEKE